LPARLEARGHAELLVRATSAYDKFVASGRFRFRRRGDVKRIADVVKFSWEMFSADGDVAGIGLDILLLGPDGRIRRDYQFIEG